MKTIVTISIKNIEKSQKDLEQGFRNEIFVGESYQIIDFKEKPIEGTDKFYINLLCVSTHKSNKCVWFPLDKIMTSKGSFKESIRKHGDLLYSIFTIKKIEEELISFEGIEFPKKTYTLI